MTLIARLAAYFKARPNEWVDARALLSVAGFGGWRTRVSDLRRRPYDMDIRNKVSTRLVNGVRITDSHYQYVPAAQIAPILRNSLTIAASASLSTSR